jgi:hypothetical protein
MRHWWNNNQQPFAKTSHNADFVGRTDYIHVQCMLDMELAVNATNS